MMRNHTLFTPAAKAKSPTSRSLTLLGEREVKAEEVVM